MDDRLKQMQDEMSRFEAEISGTEVIPPPPLPPLPPRPIIGAGTFGAVQQQLDATAIPPPPLRPPVSQNHNGSGLPPLPLNGPSLPVPQRPHIGPPAPPAGFQVPPMMPMMPPMMFGNIPPPPPPPSMLIPTQVQRMRPPAMMGDMGNMGMPPGMFAPPFMRPSPPPRPSRPQPVVLSSAPQLYKNKAKESEKKTEPLEKIEKPERPAKLARLEELPSPAPDPVMPTVMPTTAPYHSTGDVVVPPTKTNKKEKKNKKTVRTSGGQVWEDPTLLDWPEDDFRLFCGDLGNDVTDELLIRTFSKYASFQRAKVVRDKRTNKSKGFGFLSFKDPTDFIKATKEMNGRYVGSRPIKLRKSTWRNRSLDVVRKKDKEKAALLSMLTQGAK